MCRDRDSANRKRELRCAITGQPAKYFDPLTRMPYATVDAFKRIRTQYPAYLKMVKHTKSHL